MCRECVMMVGAAWFLHLQYDHHCVWLNNCIGFGNLRVFIHHPHHPSTLSSFFSSLLCTWSSVASPQFASLSRRDAPLLPSSGHFSPRLPSLTPSCFNSSLVFSLGLYSCLSRLSSFQIRIRRLYAPFLCFHSEHRDQSGSVQVGLEVASPHSIRSAVETVVGCLLTHRS